MTEELPQVAIPRTITPMHCPKCRRQTWSQTSPISIDQCESTGCVSCVLTVNQNNLVAAFKSCLPLITNTVAPKDSLVLRTALAVIEHVRPSSRSCPLCERTNVVKGTTVAVHHANNEDTKPCDASYKMVLGGVLI